MSSLESRFENIMKLSSNMARLRKPCFSICFLASIRLECPALISSFSREKKPIFTESALRPIQSESRDVRPSVRTCE